MMATLAVPFSSFSVLAGDTVSGVTADTTWYNENASVYEIADGADFLAFVTAISNGVTFEGKTVKLTDNVVVSTTNEQQAINLCDKGFAGTFDGQEHYVSGYKNTVSAGLQGILGSVATGKTATVKNVAFVDCAITLTGSDHAVAGIFGRVNGTATIDNVYNDIDVTKQTSDDRNGYGGFCGKTEHANATITVTNSVYTGTVNVPNNMGVATFVGAVYTSTRTITVTDCAAYGSITGSGNSTGVVIGRVQSACTVNITNVIASGSITNGSAVFLDARLSSTTCNIVDCAYTAELVIYKDGNNASNGTFVPVKQDATSTTVDALKTTAPDGFAARTNSTPIPVEIMMFSYIEQGHVCTLGVKSATETTHTVACTDTACPGGTDSVGVTSEHYGGSATCIAKAKCTACNTPYGETTPHRFDVSSYKTDATGHYHTCNNSACTLRVNEGAHEYGEWTVTKEAEIGVEGIRVRECVECGYEHSEAIAALSAPTTDNTDNEENTDNTDNKDSADTTDTADTADTTDETDAPKASAPETDETTEQEGGCGSAVLGSIGIVAVTALGACVTFKRKRR